MYNSVNCCCWNLQLFWNSPEWFTRAPFECCSNIFYHLFRYFMALPCFFNTLPVAKHVSCHFFMLLGVGASRLNMHLNLLWTLTMDINSANQSTTCVHSCGNTMTDTEVHNLTSAPSFRSNWKHHKTWRVFLSDGAFCFITSVTCNFLQTTEIRYTVYIE